MRKFNRFLALSLVLLFITAAGLAATSFDEARKRISRFTLPNGITCLVMERHDAPVVSFVTYFDVGGSNEVKGITGLAHVFEHMAFKGTTEIGTADIVQEKKIMDEIDRVFNQIVAEKKKPAGPDAGKLEALQKQMATLQDQQSKLIKNNEFVELLERNGGSGTNAGTSADSTVYYINVPSNKLELWAWMESERIVNPVMREFYKEKEVIKEERRMRTESNPIGRMVEEVQAVAFKAHPYGEPVIGHMSDIEVVSRAQAQAFHDRYYVGSNMTIAIAGDVTVAEIKPLLEKYFGRIPAGEKAGLVPTREPLQKAEKRILIEDPSQPLVLLCYHKPDVRHPDSAVYDVIQDVMGGGNASRLYTKLVKQDKLAMMTGAFPGFPGTKYPNLFLFFALPNAGHTAEELEKAMREEIEKLKNEPISDQELKRVQNKSQAQLYQILLSNGGMADRLAYYEAVTGDYNNLFQQLEKLQHVSKEDVTRVAKECFRQTNLTVGLIVHQEAPAAQPQPQQ